MYIGNLPYFSAFCISIYYVLFGHKKTFAKAQLKILTIFLKSKIFFAHLEKVTIAVKFHTKSFFSLRDMNDYHQTNHCAKKVGFPKYGHIILVIYS